MDKKTRPIYLMSIRNPLQKKRHTQTEGEGMEKGFPGEQKWKKKAGVVTLISDKLELRVKDVTGDKEGHFIILKGATQQEEITLVKIYTHNTGEPKYIKKKKKKTAGGHGGRD